MFTIEITVIVENVNRGNAVFLKKFFHFCGGVPPVIVVALQNNFPARKAVDEQEVLQALLEADAPGGVPAEDCHVVLFQAGEGRRQACGVVRPPGAEDVHRFIYF